MTKTMLSRKGMPLDLIYSKCKHTVKYTASIASRRDVTTFCFFSLNFSKIAETIDVAYGANLVRNPVDSPATHLPAKATTTTLLSFVIVLNTRK